MSDKSQQPLSSPSAIEHENGQSLAAHRDLIQVEATLLTNLPSISYSNSHPFSVITKPEDEPPCSGEQGAFPVSGRKVASISPGRPVSDNPRVWMGGRLLGPGPGSAGLPERHAKAQKYASP